MKTKLFGLVAMSLALFAFTTAPLGDYKVSTKTSKIEWVGKKVTGQHSGTISLKEGSINTDGNKVTGGSFTFDMTSINVTDLKAGQGKEKLEGHLGSGDFFNIAEHKTSMFKVKSVSAMDEDARGYNHKVSGDLTIKGITKPISFPARIEFRDNAVAVYADFNVDRTMWDIKYGSGKFFDSLGDNMIEDNFQIKLQIAASK